MPARKSKEKVMGCRDFAEIIFYYLANPDSLALEQRTFIENHRRYCEICESKVFLYKDIIIFLQENPGFCDTLPIEREM